MNKFFLACLGCLAFAAFGNSQDLDQTLTSGSLEPVAAQDGTFTDDEPTSILESTDDFEDITQEPQSVTETMQETAGEDVVESDLESVEEITELQIGEVPNPVLEQSNPVIEQLNPGLEQLNPVLDQSNTIIGQPNTTIGQPNTIIGQPNTILEQPNTVFHQPQSTFIPSELNRIQPSLPVGNCDSCQVPRPVVNYYAPPAIQPYPVAVSAAPVNRYVAVQPVRPIQPVQQQMQLTKFTVYSYNTVSQQTVAQQAVAQQGVVCQPRMMGPIERIFRRFR